MRVFDSVYVASLCAALALGGPCAAQETNFSAGPQYLMTSGSPLFAQPIATPSLDLNAPLPGMPPAFDHARVAEHVSYTTVPELEGQADLFPIYYGVPRVSVVKIGFPEMAKAEPVLTAWVDTGVSEVTDAEALRIRGYGITLGEYARYWKAHTRPAQRRYTNEDIERLHQRS
jgi:hypothetical protein